MLQVPKLFPAISTALPLRARCGKARSGSAPLASLHLPHLEPLSCKYSSIAAAMLKRAETAYQQPIPRKEVAALQSSKSNSLEDLLRNSQPSQKSLAGFANSRSPSLFSTQETGFIASSVLASRPTINGISSERKTSAGQSRKRTSSEMQGLAGVLHRTDSFAEHTSIDLTQSPPKGQATVAPAEKVPSLAAYEFDSDDFDNDSDLDLELDFPMALPPMSAPRRPLETTSANKSPSTVVLPNKNKSPLVEHASSAISWASSPLSHMRPPPKPEIQIPAHATVSQSIVGGGQTQNLISSEPSIDANPRPAKRRSKLPWTAEELAEQEEARKQAERDRLRAARKEYGAGNETPRFGKFSAESTFTPLPKDLKGNHMPWNTTASEMKNRKNSMKRINGNGKAKSVIIAGLHDEVKANANARPATIFLSEEQKNVLDLVVNRKQSCFFTGSAGTGKSVLMRSIIGDLKKLYVKEPDRIAVTASTGLAACNIGGVTLHSFSGIGLGKEDSDTLVKKIKKNAKAKMRWMRTKVLIIDEISMVDGELFDKLESIARKIRNNGRPFGGIQLVITGDFFQLPPVPDYGGNRSVKFAFDATTWPTSINHTIGLTQVFRQRDPVFANMLNEMRLGKLSDATVKAFRRLDRDLEGGALDATELFPTRNEVENANSSKMRNLKGRVYPFRAQDSGTITDPNMRAKLLANCMAPPVIELKKGAQVMLIKNLDDGLVNGSLGQVVGFMDQRTFNYYTEHEDEFQDGERIVADDENLPISKRVLALTSKDSANEEPHLLPVVRFSMPDGTSRDCQIKYEDWKMELPNGEIQAARNQLPLILAWALSIHKAQGQTLDRVKVDLRRVFENGQAYVALSRATTQAGLCVKNFNVKAVMAHPKVAKFYESLYDINKSLKYPKLALTGKKWHETGQEKPIQEMMKKEGVSKRELQDRDDGVPDDIDDFDRDAEEALSEMYY